MKTENILVWDKATRFFHWGLVASVSLAMLTADEDLWLWLHLIAGYAVLGLLLLRLSLGFAGREFSRFSNFAYGLKAGLNHLWLLVQRKPAHYVGHNPAGALMVFALLGTLFLLILSGFIALGGEEKQGPLAGLVSYRAGHMLKEIHEFLAGFLMTLVGLHIAGVILESLFSKQNLVSSMFSGLKAGNSEIMVKPAQPLGVTALFLALVLALALGFSALANVKPKPLAALEESPVYVAECGSCHHAFHPTLLPAASWEKMLGGLEDHFGEDASLSPDKKAVITPWLTANAADFQDYEVSHKLRMVDSQNPLRITKSPAWVKKHRDVKESQFKLAKNPINCPACHLDAAKGYFQDQAIKIPEKQS